MSNDEHKPRVVEGEVLPPMPRSVSLAPEVDHLPAGLFGIGFLARAQYASERKQFDAYRQLVEAKNALIGALTQQQRLVQDYVGVAERSKNLDKLREMARLQVDRELAQIKGEAELGRLRFENEKERLLYETDRLRKAREELNAPSKAAKTAEPKTLAEGFEQVTKDIEEVEREFQKFKAEMVRRAGGEENLSDEQREHLKRFELLRDKLVNDAMEVLF